jgi:hypothetical protein
MHTVKKPLPTDAKSLLGAAAVIGMYTAMPAATAAVGEVAIVANSTTQFVRFGLSDPNAKERT